MLETEVGATRLLCDQVHEEMYGRDGLYMNVKRQLPSLWIAMALLLASFVLTTTSARFKSATFDEDAYVGKGAAVWFRGSYGLRTAHPVLAPLLGTAPLLSEPELAETVQTLAQCKSGSARSCGRSLLFFHSDTPRVLFLVRLPTMALLVILCALVYRWASALYGRRGGLLALSVCVFEPNLLAHGRLLALDLSAALCVCLVLYTAWQFWRRPQQSRLVLWGVALGLAGATRYTLGFLVPVLMGIGLLYAIRSHKLGVTESIAAVGVAGVVAAITVWAIYAFSFGAVPDWEVRLPAPAYFYDLKELLAYRHKPQDAFLLGRHYTGGWWPYFLVTLAVKTPLPILALTSAALISLVDRGTVRGGEWVLIIASGFYYGLSLFSPFNIGHRHLLPILPLLSILIGRLAPRMARGRPVTRYVVLALIAWLMVGTLRIYPDFLAYFNELVGPRNGYRVLVDSNLDWGQDLPALEQYVDQHDISSLYLSWFGESRPSQYRIPFRAIPSKPDELSDIFTRVYHPDYPPPGIYAISATNLQGLLFDDKDLFDWFRQREPVAHLGHSILIYEVPRLLDVDAPSINVSLGSKQIDEVSPIVFEERWHTNDLQLSWFEAGQSCVLPGHGETWYVVDAAAWHALSLCLLWGQADMPIRAPTRGGDGELNLSYLQAPPETREAWLAKLISDSPLIISDEVTFAPGEAPELRREVRPPVQFGDRLQSVGYRISSVTLQPGSEWPMVSYWRVLSDDGGPLKLFVQLLDDAGNPRAQRDGLDIPAIGWRSGDVLIQTHMLSVPQDLQAGRYWVQFGAYDAQTVSRLPVLIEDKPVGTRLLLPSLEAE